MDRILTSISHAEMLLKCVLEAGKAVMKIYNDDTFWIESKEDNSPLTSADILANDIILSYLIPTGIPILSEESKKDSFSVRKNWSKCWIVDPIDGTKEFIKKNGQFTINVALAIDGKSMLGIVYAPAIDKLYIGEAGKTAFQIDDFNSPNPKILEIPQTDNNRPYTVVASKSHLNQKTVDYINLLKKTHGEDLQLTSIGSSLKICLVASGDADIYPRFAPTCEWDTAAGHAIVKAAGKNIYFSDSNTELQYNKEDVLNPWFIVK
jgi:3'(2'), 5'-bisphosphate nucleotidase